jgi:hypothetical protein
MSATTTQLLSSGEFCKLRYDTIPVKSGSANLSFYTNNSKIPNFGLLHSVPSVHYYALPEVDVRNVHKIFL